MFKFLMNLFNIGKKKVKDDDIKVEIDRENGKMTILSSRNLSTSEIMNIFREYMEED